LLPEPPDAGRLVRMSVAQTVRRQGLGRQVVAELVDRARRRGMTCVRVATDTPWHSALALYRACGFVEVGTDETDTHFELRL
jgi:GNAT superfamily N-acetyltransferase